MFNYTKVDDSKVEFIEIAPVAELPNGERLFVELEGRSLVIFNIAGQFFANLGTCLVAERSQLLRNERGRSYFLKSQLGMGVQVLEHF